MYNFLKKQDRLDNSVKMTAFLWINKFMYLAVCLLFKKIYQTTSTSIFYHESECFLHWFWNLANFMYRWGREWVSDMTWDQEPLICTNAISITLLARSLLNQISTILPAWSHSTRQLNLCVILISGKILWAY